MSWEVGTSRICSSWYQRIQVPSSRLPTHYYTVTFDGAEGPPHCTCPAFEYSKDDPAHCKHIDQAAQMLCLWHGQWGGMDHEEDWTPEYQVEGPDDTDPCPRCGGKTITVKVAV